MGLGVTLSILMQTDTSPSLCGSGGYGIGRMGLGVALSILMRTDASPSLCGSGGYGIGQMGLGVALSILMRTDASPSLFGFRVWVRSQWYAHILASIITDYLHTGKPFFIL